MQSILDAMDNVASTKRSSTAMTQAASESLTLPKRQRKLSSFLNQVDKDKMDLSYARMIFMSAVKATFLDSPFTKDYFMVSVCVCVCHQDYALFPTEEGKLKIPMNPKRWWQLHGAQWPVLQLVALRIFFVGTSSSTSERNFR